MFNRSIQTSLVDWSRQSNRKPLIIRGARQVGKTTAVDNFAKTDFNYLHLNLEQRQAAELFDQQLSPRQTVEAIFVKYSPPTSSKKTLVFLDEIQNSPSAVAMLRYFYEEFPDLYVIAAGSLLELMMARTRLSFPVGRVDFRYLYPMTFSEYIDAISASLALEYYHKIPCPDLAHPSLYADFHQYSLLGGMPEVLENYVQSGDIIEAGRIMDRLLISFQEDFPKYASTPKTINYLQHVVDKAPLSAGKRIKFARFGDSTYGNREMGEALRSLERAMIIRLLYPTTQVTNPISPNLRKSPKLFFLDTGLVNYFAGLRNYFYQSSDLHAFHRGLIAEHIVYQEIIAADNYTNRNPMFWVREERRSSAEVDYILPIEGQLIPVEVKAGPTGKLRSLHQFMQRSGGKYAIRLHSGELRIDPVRTPTGCEFQLLSLPYFLAGKLNEYGQWFLAEY